jgi:hypothetical protein
LGWLRREFPTKWHLCPSPSPSGFTCGILGAEPSFSLEPVDPGFPVIFLPWDMINPFTGVAADVAFNATPDQRRSNLKPDKASQKAAHDDRSNPRTSRLSLPLVRLLLMGKPRLP